jgi:hypothetical protein
MVPSSVLAASADGEHLTCGGFSLYETVCFGSLESITDCFSDLRLSPRRKNSGVAFMGSTRSGSPSPQRAMIDFSTEEFHMTSSGEGAPASPLLEGVAPGLCLLPSQPHHGWRML